MGLGIKDIRLVLAAAEDLRVPLPIASLLRDRFLALLASGGGDLDWSAIATLAQRDAGLRSQPIMLCLDGPRIPGMSLPVGDGGRPRYGVQRRYRVR